MVTQPLDIHSDTQVPPIDHDTPNVESYSMFVTQAEVANSTARKISIEELSEAVNLNLVYYGSGAPTITPEHENLGFYIDTSLNRLYYRTVGAWQAVDRGLTTDNTLSNEQVQDIVGAMFTDNSVSGITLTYNDESGKIDIVVPPVLLQGQDILVGTATVDLTTGGQYIDSTIDLPATGDYIFARVRRGERPYSSWQVVGRQDLAAESAQVGTAPTNHNGLGYFEYRPGTGAPSGFVLSRSAQNKILVSRLGGVAHNDYEWQFRSVVIGALTERQVRDIVGGMFSGNTETNITATYDQIAGKIDLQVGAPGGNTGTETVLHNGTVDITVNGNLVSTNAILPTDGAPERQYLMLSLGRRRVGEAINAEEHMVNLQSVLNLTALNVGDRIGDNLSSLIVLPDSSGLSGHDVDVYIGRDSNNRMLITSTRSENDFIPLIVKLVSFTGSGEPQTTDRAGGQSVQSANPRLNAYIRGFVPPGTIQPVITAQANVSDEQIEDAVGAMLTRGTQTGGSLTYNDNEGSLNLAVSGGAADAETIQDTVGGMVTGNTETNITVTYDDTTGKLNFDAVGPGTAPTVTTSEVQAIVGGMVSGNVEAGIDVGYDSVNNKLDFTVLGAGDEGIPLNRFDATMVADGADGDITARRAYGSNAALGMLARDGENVLEVSVDTTGTSRTSHIYVNDEIASSALANITARWSNGFTTTTPASGYDSTNNIAVAGAPNDSTGVVFGNNRWYINDLNKNIRVWDAAGNRVSGSDISGSSAFPRAVTGRGVAYADNKLFLVNYGSSANTIYVRAWNTNGTRATANDFEITSVTTRGRAYITSDGTDLFIFTGEDAGANLYIRSLTGAVRGSQSVIAIPPPATQSLIIGNPTILGSTLYIPGRTTTPTFGSIMRAFTINNFVLTRDSTKDIRFTPNNNDQDGLANKDGLVYGLDGNDDLLYAYTVPTSTEPVTVTDATYTYQSGNDVTSDGKTYRKYETSIADAATVTPAVGVVQPIVLFAGSNTVSPLNIRTRSDSFVQQVIGSMVSGNTERNITVSFDTVTEKLNFINTGTVSIGSVTTNSATWVEIPDSASVIGTNTDQLINITAFFATGTDKFSDFVSIPYSQFAAIGAGVAGGATTNAVRSSGQLFKVGRTAAGGLLVSSLGAGTLSISAYSQRY